MSGLPVPLPPPGSVTLATRRHLDDEAPWARLVTAAGKLVYTL